MVLNILIFVKIKPIFNVFSFKIDPKKRPSYADNVECLLKMQHYLSNAGKIPKDRKGMVSRHSFLLSRKYSKVFIENEEPNFIK